MDTFTSGVIAAARAKAADAAEQRRIEKIRVKQKIRCMTRLRDEFIASYLRPVRVEDYQAWLAGWIEKYVEGGGDAENICVYNYPITSSNMMFVAISDIPEVPKLYGSMAMKIIIPEGLEAPKSTRTMPYGHIELYFMDGFEINGTSSTPAIYSDI